MAQLKICSLNANSLVEDSRVGELGTILYTNNIDICLLQETFWKNQHDHRLNGYTIIRNDRSTRGGGTAIVIKDSLNPMTIPISNMVVLAHLRQ